MAIVSAKANGWCVCLLMCTLCVCCTVLSMSVHGNARCSLLRGSPTEKKVLDWNFSAVRNICHTTAISRENGKAGKKRLRLQQQEREREGGGRCVCVAPATWIENTCDTRNAQSTASRGRGRRNMAAYLCCDRQMQNGVEQLQNKWYLHWGIDKAEQTEVKLKLVIHKLLFYAFWNFLKFIFKLWPVVFWESVCSVFV